MRCQRVNRVVRALLCLLLCPWLRGEAGAHPAYLTAAQVTVEPDGSFQVSFRFDTLAYALNDTSARIGNEPMEALLNGPREELEQTLAKAGERLRRGCRIVTDAGDADLELVSFPDAAQVLAWRDEHPATTLPVVIPARLSGRLPAGARTVACRFPSVLEQVILTVERPDEEPAAEAVQAGSVSAALPVRVAVPARAAPPPGATAPALVARRSIVKTKGLFLLLTGVLLPVTLTGWLAWRQRR